MMERDYQSCPFGGEQCSHGDCTECGSAGIIIPDNNGTPSAEPESTDIKTDR